MPVGVVEGKAHDALRGGSREHNGLQSHFLGPLPVHPPAYAGVLALRVFADAYHVDGVPLGVAQGRGHAVELAHGPQVHVLVEALADGQQQAPQRYVVGDGGAAHRPHQNGFEPALLQLVQAVGGHHGPGSLIVARPPVERPLLKAHAAMQLLQLSEHLPAGRNNFRPDAVGGENGEVVVLHGNGVGISGIRIECLNWLIRRCLNGSAI